MSGAPLRTRPGERLRLAMADRLRGTVAAPRVSAIIIFLDAEAYLDQAIESVATQSERSWELLLVDDGSRDGSREIAELWRRRLPRRVRVLEHPGGANRGTATSRNVGVAAARGEFVAFLDADDVWLPRKLEEQLALFAAHPDVEMVYGRTLLWHSWNPRAQSGASDGFLDLGVPADSVVPPPTLPMLMLERRAQTPTTCNALVRRRAFAELGGFPEGFEGMFEDQAFFSKLGLRHATFVAGDCWAWYRQRDDGCCARWKRLGLSLPARIRFLRWLEAYLATLTAPVPRLDELSALLAKTIGDATAAEGRTA